MKTVFIAKAMDSQPYENSSWIAGVFDSGEKALTYIQELEAEEGADNWIYMLNEWEAK